MTDKTKNIVEINKELKILREENAQLKLMLKEKLEVENQRKVTPEEAICVTQIRFIYETSQDRELTLEEVKKLDLFVKNLKMIRGEIIELPKKNKVDGLSSTKLIEIASIVNDESSK